MTPEKFNEFEKAMDEENREMVKALLHESPGKLEIWLLDRTSLIARFMGPTWGPTGADRTQVGPMLAHEPCYLRHAGGHYWGY